MQHLKASLPRDYLFFLDGLRAIAIVAVLLFHSDNTWLQGGFLGVDIFFVISGFIISKLLLDEWNETGELDLKNFWFKRFRRLIPAAFTMMLTSWICVLLFFPDEIDQIFEDLPYGLSFSNNWNYIINERSYFELIGRPRLFEHLWSLGIEFQFYIIWALLCCVLFRLQTWFACVLILGMALSSSYLMARLYDPNLDPSRVYFGTDTRASALFIGSLIAFIISQPKNPLSKLHYHLLDLTALLGVMGLVLFCIYAKSTDARLFQGGFFYLSLLTAVVIAACFLISKQNKFSMVLSLLSSKLFRATGVRAYGIYLWHWPVFGLTQPWVDVPMDGLELFIVRLTITLFFSEITYRFIEKPIRNGCIERAINYSMKSTGMEKKKTLALWTLTTCLGMAGCSGLLLATEKQLEAPSTSVMNADVFMPKPNSSLITAPVTVNEDSNFIRTQYNQSQPGTIAPAQTNEAETIEQTASLEQKNNSADTVRAINICDTQNGTQLSAAQNRLLIDYSKKVKTNIERVRTSDDAENKPPVFFLGDSVMIRAVPELLKLVPCMSIDSQVGRQVSTGIQILTERKNQGLLSDTVIIHLGNNSPFNASQIDKLVNLLNETKKIIFVNLKLPRNYEAVNNKLLDELSASHTNITVLDWRSNSMNSKNIFNKDGIHLSGTGAKLYATLIYDTLSGSTLNDEATKLKKIAETEKMILEIEAELAAKNAELAKIAVND